MKYFRFIPLLVLLGLVTLNSCEWKKYTEGPITSIYPADTRVENTWFWNFALENGVNRSGELQDSTIEFTSDRIVKICGPDQGCREGKWGLVSKNTKLNLIFGDSALAYDIQMLRQNEMWLFVNSNGDDIQWELKTID